MKTLSILTYHSLDASGSVVSVAPTVFADQMGALSEAGFLGISLAEAVTHRQAHGEWPERSAVLTFDDGYANFYEAAMPVLARHSFTATVFVVSGHLGRQNDWAPPPAGLGLQPMLSWPQLIELSRVGIEIGAHTRTHADLRRLSLDEAQAEIVSSRDEMADRLGHAVESFAYPFGRASQTSLDIVRGNFRAACTTELRRVGDEASHELPRVDAYYLRSPRECRRLVCGQLDAYLAVRRWGRFARAKLFNFGF